MQNQKLPSRDDLLIQPEKPLGNVIQLAVLEIEFNKNLLFKKTTIMKTFILSTLICFSTSVFSQIIDIPTLRSQRINVVTVTSSGGTLNVGGYDPLGNYVTRQVSLGPTEVLAISKKSWRPYLSLVTIPFKVRHSIDTFPQSVQTGLSNAGIVANFYNYRLTRYFNSGKQSVHQFGIGILFAPAAEELTPENTKYFLTKNSKQLFISTGLSVTYSYNDITFALVPLGLDFATTSDGKHYIYNKKLWWGFGIGISTKLFGLF